jgi:iron(II)-dependent oxidoreductase
MRTLSPLRLCGAAAATLIIFLQPLKSARSADRELSDMVRIGAGEFLMGTNDGPEDERPMHKVSVAEFSIDRHQVTNAQFARFFDAVATESAQSEKYFDIDDDDARVHRRSGRWLADQGHENRPVVEVSWFGALAFCNWVGKRIPTEAEWERAARGLDGRKFPWGSEPPDATRAHFNAGWNDFRDVGSFPKGAISDGVYNAADGREDLTQPHVRVTRGGGQDSPAGELTTTHRGQQVSRNFRSGHHNIGFRCAR